MPSERKLGDIAEIVMGQSPSGKTCNTRGIGMPLLNGPTEFGPWHPYPVQFTEAPKKLAQPGDLLFCVRGSTAGRMNWADQTYAIGRGIAAIRGKNGFPTSFLRAAIEVQLGSLLTAATGSTFPNVSKDLLAALPMPNCDVDTARRIAAVIEPIDARIRILRETNTTLESLAQAIFKSWFVDFDPVRAKAEGRDPEGMDAETAALFPSEFEESELGRIPRGWKVEELGEHCDLFKGCSYKGSGLSEDSGAYMFNLGCFSAQKVFASQNIKRYIGEYRNSHIVHAGDLIVANTDITQARDILGRALFVPEGFEPGFVSHHVFRVALKKGHRDNNLLYFLFFALREPSFRERAIGFATGTTVLAMPKEAIERHKVVMPSHECLSAFAKVAGLLFKRIANNEAQAALLVQLRDTLLPRLLSGRLQVREAEPAVEEALV